MQYKDQLKSIKKHCCFTIPPVSNDFHVQQLLFDTILWLLNKPNTMFSQVHRLSIFQFWSSILYWQHLTMEHIRSIHPVGDKKQQQLIDSKICKNMRWPYILLSVSLECWQDYIFTEIFHHKIAFLITLFDNVNNLR